MATDQLATRMFLILHDTFTGKPLVARDVLQCGLVAAELAELVIARSIGMENDRIVVAETRGPGSDPIGAFVVDSIRRQKGAHTVRRWVEALSDGLYDLAARALLDEGVVRYEQGSRLLLRRGPDRFPAVDLLRAARPRVRLEHMLRTMREGDQRSEGDQATAACAAILGALRVERVIDLDGDRAAVRGAIAEVRATLPIDLHTLVAGVEETAAAGLRRG